MSAPANTLRRIRNSLRIFREVDTDLSLGQVLMLIDIALEPGITISKLAARMDVGLSAASRTADLLGSHGRDPKPGLRLIKRVRDADPNDRRIKGLHLTEKGRKLLAKLP